MQTKITLIIDNPADAVAFESGFPALVRLAAALPELVRIESAKVWPKEDGTATPAHRTLDLYFNDYDAASRAVTTPEAGAFFGELSAKNAGFTGLFSQIEESPVLPG
jgi:hypothetical protein